MAAQYPLVWRSQGGLASEVAAVLDAVREDCAPHVPSLQRLERVCHDYDLGTEVARFRLRVTEVFAALSAGLPRDLLKGLFDMTSEAAWWLLQAYSREELRDAGGGGGGAGRSGGVAMELREGGGGGSSANVAQSEASSSAAQLARADASKKVYWESKNVLETFQSRCLERIAKLTGSLATTPDTIVWTSLVGKNCTQQLLRELELGANDPTTRDLGSRLFLAVEAAFDQYTGLRQIGDFRGLAECPFQLSEAMQLISRLYELTIVAGLQTLENLELVEEAKLAAEFEGVCNALVAEYHTFKDGVLLRLGVSSSLRELDRSGRNLNASVVLDYIREVMLVCDACVEQMTAQFNDRIRQIELMPPAKQAEIFGSMGGRAELAQRVRAHLFQIKPWARENIQVQTQSLMQREVFGKTRDDIVAILTKSREQMLEGFKALIEGRMPEPLNRLADITTHMDEIMEPMFAKKSGLRRGGKTGKMSKGRKARPDDESPVALSGMTIRGNMFKENPEEFFSPGGDK